MSVLAVSQKKKEQKRENKAKSEKKMREHKVYVYILKVSSKLQGEKKCDVMGMS